MTLNEMECQGMEDKQHLYAFLNKRFGEIVNLCESNPTKIRYGKKSIWVSDIEEAYYCERKLDFMYATKVDTLADIPKELLTPKERVLLSKLDLTEPRRDIGAEQHSEVKRIGDKEISVLGLFQGIPISGSINELVVSKNTITVIERKFRTNIPDYPYNEHEVQGRAYCYCLDYMLKDILPLPELKYSIEYYDMEVEVKDGFVKKFDKVYNEQVRKHLEDELSFILSYWLMKREPKPQRKSPNKCIDCEYSVLCPDSLV